MTQSSLERELQAEQSYVDLVLTHLHRAMTSAQALVKESRARFTSDRESWVREEHGTALFERDAFAFLAARRLAALDGEHEGLVFGRLDFLDRERRYIGRLGVRTVDYEPLVIDWRAQAAEPFYRATAVEPMQVIRRRVLTSRDDKVTGIEDDVLMPTAISQEMTIIGDGALIQALQRARGRQMQDIVATIQAEQDQIIRAPYQGFTLINGGPGTGKTVVGLHRVAFLLYTHRRRFTNGGVLVIGPSPIFMDYIEKVLPSLGEDAVTLQSLGQIGEDVLGFSAHRRDSEAACILKGSLRMISLMCSLVEHPVAVSGPLIVTAKGEPLIINEPELAQIRANCLRREPYNQARAAVESALVAYLSAQAVDVIDAEDLELVDEMVRGSWAFNRFMDQWWPPLDPEAVLARLRDPEMVRVLSDLDETEIATLSTSIDPDNWTVSDIPLLDELAQILGPVPTQEDSDPIFLSSGVDEIVTIADALTSSRRIDAGTLHATYAHILVDESQDLSQMQWRMINRRGRGASWTIIGDPAQSCWPDMDDAMRFVTNQIGNRPVRNFRLSTNYRSPMEVCDLATAFIRGQDPQIDTPQAVRSTGIPPRLLTTPAGQLEECLVKEVADLLEQVEGTIGVLGLDADRLRAYLPDYPRLVVLDPLSAKGLEFDAVVVVDPDSIVTGSVSGVRTLYVCLTRPTVRLVTIDIDKAGIWRADLVEPKLSQV